LIADDVFIPHSRPYVGAEEAAAVAAVVESGQLAQGPRVESLEAAFGSFLRICAPHEDPAAHAAAVSSGTAALFVALRALDVGAGDEVLIPAYACTSLNQAVRYVGATPRYVDCDPVTLNPDPDDARAKVSAATAACIVPHLFGLPADVASFVDLGLPVVEDCAQALGVDIGDRPVGSFGRATVCSFYATKLVAAGEGGMILSRDAELVSEAAGLRDCEDRRANPHAFNFKMTDLHAAVASVQLERLPEFLSRRRRLAERYIDALQAAPVDLPAELPDRGHAWFRFPVRLRGQNLDEIIEG
jgi:dTDP-4-amino-4,6-dideoxygalactose transaminase